MHTTLSAKNAYALVHARICNGAEASLPWKLLQTYLESCASIVQAVVCCPLLPPPLLSRPNPSPDAVRSRNPSKSTLGHDAVAAAVSHKHDSIIRVGAGLIQFLHGPHLRLATEYTHHRNVFSPFFARVFPNLPAYLGSALVKIMQINGCCDNGSIIFPFWLDSSPTVTVPRKP